MIRLSIIIPVFNALEYTKKCLTYLKDTLSPAIDEEFQPSIIVVDDGSTDGTSDWIRTNFPDTIICLGNGNLWWSGGINLGIQHAMDNLNSDYILLWNNDIRPAEDYFIRLSELLQSNPSDNIILSTIYIENKSKRIISSLGGNFNPVTGKHALIGFGQEAESFIPPDLNVNWFPGMGTIIPRSVFKKIGLFDAKYFPQYKGDADFGLRASKAGYKLTLSPQLELWNDRDNTGLSNNKSWIVFLRSLTSRKSNNNIYRDILFYHRHGKSIWVYNALFRKYFKHIGGFFKWKLLGLFGYTRNNRY